MKLIANFLSLIFLCIHVASSDQASLMLHDLFSQMTIEEKCGQMTLLDSSEFMSSSTNGNIYLDVKKLLDGLANKHLGSIYNLPFLASGKQQVFEFVTSLHELALNSTRLRIPVLYASDFIHGAGLVNESVVFPHQLAQASSFNTLVTHRIGAITGMESRAMGVVLNYSPILDIGRQPLWPRLWETFGEDVYLASKMGEAFISGHQGQDLKSHKKAAVCLKHYMGYGFPFNGRDRTNALIPDSLLREKFLPSFARGIKTGALSVMINSGYVNGIPTHANKYILTDILKQELDFKGFAVSDWQDVIRLHTRDRIAETPEDAVRLAVMAGLDMSMVPSDYSFFDHCVALAEKNGAFADRVDDAVMRILSFKETIGLFENPFPLAEDLVNIATQDSIDFNLEAARETIILAKNNNSLPLDTNRKVLVTGPTANLIGPLTGAWTYTWQGNEEKILSTKGRKKLTVYESIRRIITDVKYVKGANLTSLTNLNEAVAEAQKVDVVVLCVGETAYAETPGNINDLRISQAQTELARGLATAGKPIIVVYLGGRPRLINEIVETASGVLIAFYPGERGGEAIADVLFGLYNPSARLPITYPAHPNGFTNYDYKPVEIAWPNDYEYLFPFGHGLSYTTFEYSNLTLSSRQMTVPEQMIVSVLVKNTGSRDGSEIVMLYVQDEYASLPQPERKLKKFTKIELKAGETKNLSFCLDLDDLSFVNAKSETVFESGRFFIHVKDLMSSFDLIV